MLKQYENRRALAALVAVCIIWGTTYLINKLGVSSMPPLFFTSIRQLTAAILLLTYLFLIKKLKWPDRSFIKLQLILGLLLISGGNGLGIYGLQYIDSGISAILATFSPILIAFLMSMLQKDHHISKWTWIGLILGCLGILIICLQKIGMHPGRASIIGILFTMLSIVTWAIGSVYSKIKKHNYNPFMSAGFQMLFGGIPVLVISLLFEKPWNIEIETYHILIWAYAIVLGSLVAYSCFIYCLNHLPVTLVSIHTYINPIIAVMLGALLLGELINFWILVGAVVSLTGVYLVTKHSK